MTQPRTTTAAAPTVLYTPAEVGRRIGRSRATVYRLINAGVIDVVHLPVAKSGLDQPGIGAVRISSDALEKFMASLRGAEAQAS